MEICLRLRKKLSVLTLIEVSAADDQSCSLQELGKGVQRTQVHAQNFKQSKVSIPLHLQHVFFVSFHRENNKRIHIYIYHTTKALSGEIHQLSSSIMFI